MVRSIAGKRGGSKGSRTSSQTADISRLISERVLGHNSPRTVKADHCFEPLGHGCSSCSCAQQVRKIGPPDRKPSIPTNCRRVSTREATITSRVVAENIFVRILIRSSIGNWSPPIVGLDGATSSSLRTMRFITLNCRRLN